MISTVKVMRPSERKISEIRSVQYLVHFGTITNLAFPLTNNFFNCVSTAPILPLNFFVLA